MAHPPTPLRRLQPWAAALLGAGLAVAIATDGALPAPWSKALFAALAVLAVSTAEWLTRPRPPRPAGAPRGEALATAVLDGPS